MGQVSGGERLLVGQEVYDTERHLLYVACTRARDHLLVTGVSPASEFLEDLRA
jgi:ATP-dependent exoDNAse (exonuclease V) beta subunit